MPEVVATTNRTISTVVPRATQRTSPASAKKGLVTSSKQDTSDDKQGEHGNLKHTVDMKGDEIVMDKRAKISDPTIETTPSPTISVTKAAVSTRATPGISVTTAAPTISAMLKQTTVTKAASQVISFGVDVTSI